MDSLPLEITAYVLNFRYGNCIYKGSPKDYLNGMLVCIEWYDILRSHSTYIKMYNAIHALSGLGGYAIRRCAQIAFKEQMNKIKAVVESMGYKGRTVCDAYDDDCRIEIQDGNNNLRLVQTVSQGCFIANYNRHQHQNIYFKHHHIAGSVGENTDPLWVFTRNVLIAIDEHL